MNKKLSKYVTLMAILAINTSPILITVGTFNNNNVVSAETIGQAVTFKLNANEANTLAFWASEDSKGLNVGQRYEITFEGNGQVEIYHNHNPYETNDLIKIVDGTASGIVNRSFVEADSITIKANKDTNLKVIFTPVSELDYTYLNELISDASELLAENSDKYTADSWNRLSNAKYNAEFYLNTDYISHEELKNIENTLKNAIDNLTTLVSVVNRKPLEEIMDKVKALNETDYTTDTWKHLMTELKEAQDVYDDETSLPGGIQTATNNLNTMFQLLTKRSDFSDLNKTIEETKNYKEEDYTISTFAELQRMLKEAETVAKDLNSSQSNVDIANNNLKNAIKDLKKKGESGNNGGEETENATKLIGKITLADSFYNYYSVYYNSDKDEVSFKASDLSAIFDIEPPKTLENISLNGKTTFKVNGEQWKLVKNSNDTFEIEFDDERVIRFNSLEEYSSLVKKYALYELVDNKAVRLTDSNLDFDAKFIDLNTAEGQSYNSNIEPIVDFKFNDTSFDFNLILDESNKLSGQNFKYTYDLPTEFLTTDIYKKLEGQQQYSGYIKRNLLNAGGYTDMIMEYVLIDGKLIINVLNTALSEPSKTAKPAENFSGNGKFEEEVIKETTEMSIPAPLKRPSNGKAEEASTIKPTKKEGEVLPRMGIGPSFAGIPLILVGVISIALALVFLLRKKFPLSTKNDDSKDTEE